MKIVEVKPQMNYHIRLKFSTGMESSLDCRPWLTKGLGKELQNPTLFSQVKIDSFGGLYWPNGFDIAPEILEETI